MECNECGRYIDEDNLDLHDGEWLCHDCEERLQEEEDNYPIK